MQYSAQEIYIILVRRIVRESYSREAALPSERDIADEFETSRTVIRGILKRLDAEGYIEMLSPRKRRISPDQPTSIFNPESKMVGIIGVNYSIPGPEEKLIVSQRRIRGMFNRLDKLGLSTLNLSVSWPSSMIFDHLAAYKICGLIYVNENVTLSSEVEEFFYRTLTGRLPIATFGDTERIARGATPGIERCAADHHAGPRLLLEHMASLGIRRALWYYPCRNRPLLVWQAERQAGYEAAAREFGIELVPLPEVLPITNEAGSGENFLQYSRIISKVLSRYVGGAEPVEAIVAESDVAVPYFQRALRELGMTPGRDLPVFGYDNYYFLSGPFQWESTPPAATIDKNDLRVGEKTAELVVRRIQAGEELSDSFRETVPPRLIIPEQP